MEEQGTGEKSEELGGRREELSVFGAACVACYLIVVPCYLPGQTPPAAASVETCRGVL
jgi:hypothetical protein